MAHFKEYKWLDKVYLSIVENEDTRVELSSIFIVYPSLLRPKLDKIPTSLGLTLHRL